MLLRLALLPNLLLAVLFAAAAVATVLLAPLAVARLTRRTPSDEFHNASFEVYKVLGPLTGVFLAFLLIQSMTYFRQAETMVGKEAGDILQLDHALAGMEPAQGEPARAVLRQYIEAVTREEWPARRLGQDSPAAITALIRLQQAVSLVLTQDPERATLRAVQKNMADVEDDRTARGSASDSGLPGPLWWVTASLFGLLGLNSAFLRPLSGISVMFAIYAAGLALLAALLVMIDGPFHGDFSVSPRDLERALAVITPR